MNSFYQSTLFRTFAALRDYIKSHRKKFYIIDLNNDLELPIIYKFNYMSEAFAKMFDIAMSKSQDRFFHVSLWQRHSDGTCHRVGYREDESLHNEFIDKMSYIDTNFVVRFWRGFDYDFSGRIKNLPKFKISFATGNPFKVKCK